MCGILGGVGNEIISKNFVNENIDSLITRGPDDKGKVSGKWGAFGHTRLSMLDLSDEGHQPMLSSCGQFIIVFNGEIYNCNSLRAELEKKGHSFHSMTDTEVILEGFIRYKEKFIDKLNGMFALAIFDIQGNKLFLARDRNGIKPLYIRINNKILLFSSEASTLSVQKGNKYNKDSILLYLMFGSVPGNDTIYTGVISFPAGCYAYYENFKLSYTSFYKSQASGRINNRDIISKTRDLIFSSVERHLNSDAPIGVFLSGGLDSSVISAVAKKYNNKIEAVSLYFDNKSISEEKYQDVVSKHLGIKHHKLKVTEDIFIDNLNLFINSMDQPSIDGFNTYLASKFAIDSGMKAILSGVGSDEIFYGYSTFSRYHILKKYIKSIKLITPVFKFFNKYKKLEFLKCKSEIGNYLSLRGVFSPSEVSKLTGISKAYIYNLINKLNDENDFSSSPSINSYDKNGLFELQYYMKNQLLRDSDQFSMAHSLEIRTPFLDNNLVDYILSTPSTYKISGSYNKPLLVDSICDLLPEEVWKRKKAGFELPFEEWIRNNPKHFNISSKALWQKFENNEVHWSKIWTVFVIEKFIGMPIDEM
jgi:asparagine synthase (glutamine-hydrolysing)